MSDLPLLIEPEQLHAAQPNDNLLIIDQSTADTFIKHHIPGAVHLDFKRLQLGQAPTPGALPDIEQLSAVFSELGLTPETHVVASDDEGGGWAGRLIWALDMMGHTHYSYLNGGIHAWLDAGLPIESGAVAATASNYTAQLIEHGPALSKQEVIEQLGQADFAIWDARSALEYTGEKVNSARGGHIPGAANLDWLLLMDKDNALRLKPLADIKATLANLGIDDTKHIVTHCQTHHRSGLTYLVGKLLGFNIKAYAGSWSEWGNDPNTPVTTGTEQ